MSCYFLAPLRGTDLHSSKSALLRPDSYKFVSLRPTIYISFRLLRQQTTRREAGDCPLSEDASSRHVLRFIFETGNAISEAMSIGSLLKSHIFVYYPPSLSGHNEPQ
ncbi:unnamed protein product [Protopolystoma xenopodis]|uniref:Uncharacterized protein n=1 Tax=Protopolystoma xenopodis TaxID=117903 RepID=A0A448XCB5_9PLAT|nr:unnamed protein product [Protopolystoma xenopodis]